MRDALSTSVTTPRMRPAPAMPAARPAAPGPIERTRIERTPRVRRLESPPMSVTTHAAPAAPRADSARTYPALPSVAPRLGSASAGPALPMPYTGPRPGLHADPDVWLIALPTASGSYNALEGSARAGAIRVARPYGHLRSIRPVTLGLLDPTVGQGAATSSRGRRSGGSTGRGGVGLGSASATEPSNLPALRPLPSVVSAVEVETDAGIFRVERPDSVLAHGDLAWALANLEQGEPDPNVPLPRRQLALLLTLLPTPQDPAHPENDPTWGWAHRLRGPWERGPLHARGRLGRLIAFDPDGSGKGLHRACFELIGTEEVVWAVGVPCFQTNSVYELTPLGKGLHPSRWLRWPTGKGRAKAAQDRPAWEIARVVFRVGAPRWPLAGVVEPLGPLGVAG
jgi:hypothetical protein